MLCQLSYFRLIWGEQDSNLRRRSQQIYSLSSLTKLEYLPKIKPVEGFEPTTPRLQITCSCHLSYTGCFYFIIESNNYSPTMEIRSVQIYRDFYNSQKNNESQKIFTCLIFFLKRNNKTTPRNITKSDKLKTGLKK